MTKELRKKIAIIAVVAYLALIILNNLFIKVPVLDVVGLVALVAVAFVCSALYIKNNSLSQRDLMKEAAPMVLILFILVFAVLRQTT